MSNSRPSRCRAAINRLMSVHDDERGVIAILFLFLSIIFVILVALLCRAAWTRDQDPGREVPKVVVVVPPDGDLQRGWRLAQDLSTHGRVRLIGRGATREAPVSEQIVTTELDCYLPNDKTSILDALNAPVERWIARTFRDVLDDVAVVPAMWSSAMMRVLRSHVHAAPLALGLAAGERGHEIVLSEAWVGRPLLEAAAVISGARVRAVDARSDVFAPSLAAHTLVAACTAPLLRAVEFARETGARATLRDLRSAATGTPDVWITVTGNWPHSCRHVIEPIGRAAKTRGLRLGVLLQYTLAAGELGGGHREVGANHSVFPVLAQPALDGAVGAVDQIASAENWAELLGVVGRSMSQSWRVAARLVRDGSHPDLDGWPLDLTQDVASLARLATIDLLRAEEARVAARAVVARRSFHNAVVAFSHASLAQVAVPDQILQRAGARTVDVVHGALAEALDMTTSARTFSAQKFFWTEEEVRYTGALIRPQHCIGGVPCRTFGARSARVLHEPLRILALTNYATRASDHVRQLPRVVYQTEFFAALGAIREVDESALVRWRPHPGDDPDSIERTLREHAHLGVERSTSPTLDEDLSWADVVVSSISSTIVEAVVLDLPILVHAIPVHESEVILRAFDPLRQFFDRSTFERALRDVLTDRTGSIELALRRCFFGAGGEPRDLADALLGDGVQRAHHAGAVR